MKAVPEVKLLISALARKIMSSEVFYHPVNICIALNGLQGTVLFIIVVGMIVTKLCPIYPTPHTQYSTFHTYPSAFDPNIHTRHLPTHTCNHAPHKHTLSFSLSHTNAHSLSLSLTHTHTHTLSLSLSHKHSLTYALSFSLSHILSLSLSRTGMDDSSPEVRGLLTALMEKSISAEEQGIDKAGDREISMALFGTYALIFVRADIFLA